MPTLDKHKVLTALSGGVDSAAAAVLLREQGFEVVGVYMCLQQASAGKAHGRACCSPQDAADAHKIAAKLGCEFTVLDVGEDFETIKDDFARSYQNGRTPNPCILCNERIKFGKLFQLADSMGAHFIATGHYAQIIFDQGKSYLHRAQAAGKDQSYVLFRTPRAHLERMCFPLGHLADKSQTRDLVRQAGLTVHDKPDSQEICFAPDDSYRSVLEGRADAALTPGPIYDLAGKKVGEHQGYGLFTIGQRRGMGVASTGPLYVVKIDPQQAAITIGPREALMSPGLQASQANWLADVPAAFHCRAQIRYNHRGAEAWVEKTGDDTFTVRFDQPEFAVTPGQAAVLYDNQRVLGGGWIDAAL